MIHYARLRKIALVLARDFALQICTLSGYRNESVASRVRTCQDGSLSPPIQTTSKKI